MMFLNEPLKVKKKSALRILSIHLPRSSNWKLGVSRAPFTPGGEASDMGLTLKASQISHSNSSAKLSPSPGPADVGPLHQLHLVRPADSILNMTSALERHKESFNGDEDMDRSTSYWGI